MAKPNRAQTAGGEAKQTGPKKKLNLTPRLMGKIAILSEIYGKPLALRTPPEHW
jgi:hypothetical protein